MLMPSDSMAAITIVNTRQVLHEINPDAQPVYLKEALGRVSPTGATGTLKMTLMSDSGCAVHISLSPAYYHPDAEPLVSEEQLLEQLYIAGATFWRNPDPRPRPQCRRRCSHTGSHGAHERRKSQGPYSC